MSPFNPVSDSDVRDYVESNIGLFHSRRLDRLNSLNLKTLLKRKNPYLFKSKNIQTAQDLLQPMLDAHLSSQEETLFGNFLEGLGLKVAEISINGRKSGIEGIDLEFENYGSKYIVAIKSGPNWGNSSQIRKMKDDFSRAKRILRQGNPALNVVAVNGCCYGETTGRFDRGEYVKLAGQAFWRLISGDSNFYLRIIEPLGYQAKRQNDDFQAGYAGVLNRMSAEFISDYCLPNGQIGWDRLVEFNSKAHPSSSKVFS